MTLRGLIPEAPPGDQSLVLVEGDHTETTEKLLGNVFADQPVEVETTTASSFEEDTVLLVEDGAVVAQSPVTALQDAILLVNSDLFTTGTRQVEAVEVPAVLRGLEDVPFRLRGYPESNTEKLLLIVLSRYVERQALEAGKGVLRSSFQRLSRIDDEIGTRRVYERLAVTDLDVHVYGVPDWDPTTDLDVVSHGGRGPNFRRAWFVLFTPTGGAGTPHGLLAYETEPRYWHGFYTTDPARVSEIDDAVCRRL
ncbi:MAG: DICT sensory domain-containing protein [Halodesulfurarchaeum sp.]